MTSRKNILLTCVFILLASVAEAEVVSVSFLPPEVIQGEPLMIQVGGLSLAEIKKITFDKKSLNIFVYVGKPSALVGIDLYKKPGNYEVTVELYSNSTIKSNINVGTRERIVEPLGIPEKLGGNTTHSQNKLVSTLADENKTLENIRTGTHAFWTLPFALPLSQTMITDQYGYSRQTGAYSIPHKGVDYRAKEGTPVLSINRGVVRIVKEYRNYGRTVVVDHGLGVMSFYLHLSKIKVKEGVLVQRGQIIGLSGQTGYVTAPHLHLSLRISGVSVDPAKFFEIFK